MGITCPQKPLIRWKDLVEAQNEDLAYFLWNEHSGNVPIEYYLPLDKYKSKLLKETIKFKPKVNDAQYKKMLSKLEVFNLKYGSRVSITRGKQVAETTSFNIELNENWANFNPKQRTIEVKIKDKDTGVKQYQTLNTSIATQPESKFTPLAEDLTQTDVSNQILEDNSSEMFRLPTAEYQENLESLDNKLIDILQRKYGMTVNIVDDLKTRLNTDALGFTKLLTGTAEINIRTYRDIMTVPEEAAHIFIAMLDGTPLYNRLINWLGKEDYYKKVLDNEYEQYNELYKGNVNKLKIEAAGKLLGQTFITRNVIPPVQVKSLLERIWDAIKRLVGKFPINEIERELNILTNEISDAALSEKMDSIQGSTENIKPFVEEDLSILYQVGNKIKTEQQLKDQTLTSIAKRIQYFKRTGQDKKIAKYQQLEEEYNKFIDDGNYLKGIGLYLQTLSEEKKGFNKGLKQIKQSFNNPEREDLRSVAKNLRQMHTVINNNSSTLENLIDLFGDFLYDSDYEFKAEAKELKKASEKMLSYFNRLEKDYVRIGLQVTAEMMVPLLGKRNDTDVLADLNRNRPANKQLSILNLEEALLKGDADINFINRWLDAVAEVPDDLLKILDVAVKNQKIESQQETLEDKKVLLDAQDKLKESTEFVAEKVDGKLTGNIITEVDWGLMQKKESDFFKQLNTEVKSKYGYEYKDFISKSDELMKKFSQAEYITDRQNYKKQIARLFSATRLSDEEIAKELEGKSDIWKHFNTETNEDGRLIIPRTKSKSFQDIQSNPNQLEYYNVVTNLMYELDSLLPEQKRLGRKLPQIRKDFVERLKMAIKDKSTEAYASIFKELQENFQVLEDEDRRGMKFELSDDGITPIKFLPIYYVNRLSNPNEISTDITSSLTIFSSMARDYGKMNEIIDLMEIARDVINVRDIVRTDSKGNPEVESVKTAKSKLLRTLFIPQGTSRMADLLHDFYNMQIYGELEKEEKIAGTNLDRAKIIDALTRYAALNMLSLNVFSGFQNVVTGVAQEKIDSVAKEFISFDALKFADGKYYGLKNFSNLLGSAGSIDGKNPVTGEHSELILWGEKFDVMQDFKSENKELDSSRKTIFGRLFKTSTLMFIQKSGENWLNMRTSLALAHEYRYSKDLEKFVWKEDFYMPLRKLEYKRKDEIHNMFNSVKIRELRELLNGGRLSTERKLEIKEEIKSLQVSKEVENAEIDRINAKYKQEESALKEKLGKYWKEMTNYYDAHEKIGRRLKLKSEFKENKEDIQAFIKKTNFLNKRFHGIYNDADKSAAQQFALFRVVNLFRKFMVPFWNRRYGKTQFNYEGQAWTEGYYITVFNFIRNIIMESRAGEYSLRKNWATLSELEKSNFRRAMMDAGQVLGMMVIAMILGLVAEGGDDDEWTLQMALYMANRSITELGAFTPSPLMLSEGLRTIQSPSAAITPLKRIADLMQPWEWNNEIERGRYKGWTKGEKLLYQSVPALNKLKDVASPNEMMVFYTGR